MFEVAKPHNSNRKLKALLMRSELKVGQNTQAIEKLWLGEVADTTACEAW